MTRKRPEKNTETPPEIDLPDWTRSFPQGSAAEKGWMLGVLDDLQAYATTHDLTEIAETLAETRKLVLSHLSKPRH